MRRRTTSKRADDAMTARSELDAIDRWFELCIDEKRLKKIKDRLALLGVKMDKSMLDGISEIALRFSGPQDWKRGPTPQEAALDIRKTIAAIDALLKRFDESHHNYIDPQNVFALRAEEWFVFPPTSLLATEDSARAALTAMRAELQRRADKLMAMRGNRNAAKVHRECWTALTELYRAKVPDATSRPRWRKDLHLFLEVFSEPMFPEETTTSWLTAFVDSLKR